MMRREILFRAKRYSGEWVYGYYVHQFGAHQILSRDGDEYQHESYHINPETVGQYTGLKDKNGNKIFEGDIVRYNCTLHEVVFCTINGCAFFGITMPERGEIWNFDGITDAERTEIVGNIYDNLGLIGGVDNAELH